MRVEEAGVPGENFGQDWLTVSKCGTLNELLLEEKKWRGARAEERRSTDGYCFVDRGQ